MKDREYIKTYCYHCGKELTTEAHPLYNVHLRCYSERKQLFKSLRSVIWKKLMEDPVIRKKILEIDLKIIKEHLKKKREILK